jgi:hypothetical protein
MLGKPNCYVAKVGIFLITVALIAGMVGCGPDIPPPEALEIWDWYDLDAIRDNLGGSYILMNDLDSTTAGYEELASPTANQGKGWQPIGSFWSSYGLTGTFDGQGYEIRDLFINRPDEGCVGLFVIVDAGERIENIGVVNATVTGYEFVGGLVGGNEGIMSNSYSTGSVTGDLSIGGLVGENRGTVSDSHSTGSVTGYSNVGGLVGWNEDGTVSNSFWDTETSGQATSAGGTGKNTTEMKSIVTFSGAGWNIIAVAPGPTNTAYIWNIVNGLTYPFLSWEP